MTPAGASSGATGIPTPSIVLVCGLAFEARVAAGSGIATLCWSEPERLEQLLAERVGPECRGLVSFGTCGGLDPRLLPGQWIIADEVVSEGAEYRADPAWATRLRDALPGAVAGRVAASGHAIVSRADKARLAATSHARTVDMESHLVARCAQRLSIPFAVTRVVIDPASRSLPRCAQLAVRPDGGTTLLPLALGLLRRPWELAPLFVLARDAGVARRALGDGRQALNQALLWPSQPGFA